MQEGSIARSPEAARSAIAPTENEATAPLILQKRLVGVAPGPALAGLRRCDDGVLRSAKVPGSVLVLGVVAAAYVAALLANAQMHPGIAQGHALGAYVLRVVLEVVQVERGEMLAGSVHYEEVGK
jgi:hypothetical protein